MNENESSSANHESPSEPVRVVVFTRNNARILINPPEGELRRLRVLPNVVVNPDLSRVAGFPPHYWKLVGGAVFPLDAIERAKRDREHDQHGVDNFIGPKSGAQPAQSAPSLIRHLSFPELLAIALIELGVVSAVAYLIFKGVH